MLHVPRAPARARGRQLRRRDPLTPITVKTAVSEQEVAYLYERQTEFPGVRIVQTFLRDYEYRAAAAHLLGYVGEISPEELKARRSGRSATAPGTRSARQASRRRSTATCAAVPAPRRSASTRSGARSGRRSSREEAKAGDGDPAHARHRAAAGRRARAPRGDRDREGERGVQRGRRRDRGARPAGRRDPRDGLEPDLQAVDLRRQARPGQAALAARPGRGGARELPRPQPRLGGPVSARLDVQAGRRARRDAGPPALVGRVDLRARRPSATASTSSSSRTGTRTSAAR